MCVSGCVATNVPTGPQYVFMIPTKLERPQRPEFLEMDNTALTSKTNFKKLQQNIVLLREYNDALVDTVEYYEKTIDYMEDEKKILEEKGKAIESAS